MGINRDKVLASAQKQVRKGNWEKAIRDYESLVEDDPSDVRSLLKVGDLHVKANNFEDALVAYQQVAYHYAKDDFYEKAAAVYKQALRIAPENPSLHRDLGEAYFRLGRLKDSIRSFHRAQKLYKAAGNDAEQRTILERMTQIDPADVGLKVQLAERYEKDGFRDDAVSLLNEAAETLYEEGRNDEFLQVGERIVYLDPEAHGTRKDVIRIYIDRGDDRRALKHLQSAFRKTPKDVQILEMLAKTFGRVGNPDKAVLVYQELANAYHAIGQDGRAKTAYRAILEIDPDNDVARANLPDELRETAGGLERDTGVLDQPETQDALDGVEFLDDDLADELSGVEFLDDDEEAGSRGNDFMKFAEETVAGVDASIARIDEDPGTGLSDRQTEVSDITDQVELVADSPTEESVVEVVDDEIGSLLTEIDVFLKYGLFDRAENTITRIIELAPNNLRAREQMRRFFELTGEREAAAGQLIQMARIAKDNPTRASGYLRRALETTEHPERVEEFAQRLGLSFEADEEIAELGNGFLDEVSEGISEASEVFIEDPSVEEPGAHTVDLEPELGDGGLSGESAVEDDEYEDLGDLAEIDDLAGAIIDEMEAAEAIDTDELDIGIDEAAGVAEPDEDGEELSIDDVEIVVEADEPDAEIDEEIDEDEIALDMADVEEMELGLDDVDGVDLSDAVDIDDDFDMSDFDDAGAIEVAEMDDLDMSAFDGLDDDVEIDDLDLDGEVMDLDVDDVDFDDSELDALQDAIDDADFEFSFTEGEADEMFDELFGGSSLDMGSDFDVVEEVEEEQGTDSFNPFGDRSLSSKFQAELSEMTEFSEGGVINSNLELGGTYRDMGLWEEALDEFKQALDDPDVEHAASFNVAVCQAELGEMDEAMERLRALTETGRVPGPIRAAASAKLEELAERQAAGA